MLAAIRDDLPDLGGLLGGMEGTTTDAAMVYGGGHRFCILCRGRSMRHFHLCPPDDMT